MNQLTLNFSRPPLSPSPTVVRRSVGNCRRCDHPRCWHDDGECHGDCGGLEHRGVTMEILSLDSFDARRYARVRGAG